MLEDVARPVSSSSPRPRTGPASATTRSCSTLLEGLLVDDLGPVRARAVYRRSARLLEEAALLTDAVRAYAMADDVASIARLVQHHDAGLPAQHLDDVQASPDDPWLVLARARRLHREGRLPAAMAAFDRAEALLDDDELARRCRRGKQALAVWLPSGGGQATARWPPPVRGPCGAGELVRRATRRVSHGREAPDRAAGLAGVVGRLLAGDLAGARRGAAGLATAPPEERLSGSLALVVTDFLTRCPSDAVASLEEIVLRADHADQPWLSRVARGLQADVLLVRDEQEWRVAACVALVEECRRDGDGWGEAILTGALGVALALTGARTAQEWLDRAARRADDLDAPVLATWARAAAAAHATACGEADAVSRTSAAREDARRCGIVDLSLAERVRPARRSAPGTDATSPGAPTARPVPRVRCLGGFVLETTLGTVDLDGLRPLPRTLLLVLAMQHDQDVHREVLIDLLWPDTPVATAAHRLHAAASSVRRGLATGPGPRCSTTAAPTGCTCPAPCWTPKIRATDPPRRRRRGRR